MSKSASQQLRLKASDKNRWNGPEDFKGAVRTWAERIGVQPERIQIQKATKKWGSCSSSGTLTFSRDLLAKPRSIGEAVIVHELLHLQVPNHGRLFRSLLEAHLPGAADTLGPERGRSP